MIEELPENVRHNELGQVYSEVLVNAGNLEKSVEVIQKYADAAPESADRQLALGQVLTRAASQPDLPTAEKNALLARAGKAFDKAVQVAPEVPQNWLALITFQVLQKDFDGARESLRGAQLAVAEDQLVGVLAKSYEILGQWFNAENVYLTAYELQPDNLALSQELAQFYLSPAYPRPDKMAKATPLVNKILRAGADGTLEANNETLMWARRAAAQLLAATQEYQQLLKAENLLASNALDGALPAADRLRMAEILAARPEPVSRIKAKNLFEQVKKDQGLSLQHELLLGKLFYVVGDWERCKRQMLSTISQYPKSVDARAQYVSMLLERGTDREVNSVAVQQLKSLRELAANDPRTVQLMAEIGGRTGKEKEVREYLLKMLPKTNDPAQLQDNQLPLLEFVAALLVKMDDFENAEKLYRTVVAKAPVKAIALAQFLGEHRDVDQAMAMLSDSYSPDNSEAIIRVAIGIIRSRRDEIGEKYDSKVQGWIERGLLENPDSIPQLMLQAEYADLVKQYDLAAEIYQKLLARNDVSGVTRAIVLNNLAFLVALAGNEAETGVDPLKLVQEAAQILGPTSDILDTRAVVYTQKGDYQKAIDDLNYAVTDTPTAAKYFHKAVAHLGAGENSAAIENWDKAHDLTEDTRSTLNRMEFPLYDKTKTKIESIRGQKLTRAAG